MNQLVCTKCGISFEGYGSVAEECLVRHRRREPGAELIYPDPLDQMHMGFPVAIGPTLAERIEAAKPGEAVWLPYEFHLPPSRRPRSYLPPCPGWCHDTATVGAQGEGIC